VLRIFTLCFVLGFMDGSSRGFTSACSGEVGLAAYTNMDFAVWTWRIESIKFRV